MVMTQSLNARQHVEAICAVRSKALSSVHAIWESAPPDSHAVDDICELRSKAMNTAHAVDEIPSCSCAARGEETEDFDTSDIITVEAVWTTKRPRGTVDSLSEPCPALHIDLVKRCVKTPPCRSPTQDSKGLKHRYGRILHPRPCFVDNLSNRQCDERSSAFKTAVEDECLAIRHVPRPRRHQGRIQTWSGGKRIGSSEGLSATM